MASFRIIYAVPLLVENRSHQIFPRQLQLLATILLEIGQLHGYFHQRIQFQVARLSLLTAMVRISADIKESAYLGGLTNLKRKFVTTPR